MTAWTLNDWLWIFVPLALVIAAYGVAFAVMSLRSRARRKARRAEWEAERPHREELRRLEEQRSQERWKAEERRVLALIEDMRIKPEEAA